MELAEIAVNGLVQSLAFCADFFVDLFRKFRRKNGKKSV
jgi:hypothetical protein